jgi:hypothetical protein
MANVIRRCLDQQPSLFRGRIHYVSIDGGWQNSSYTAAFMG